MPANDGYFILAVGNDTQSRAFVSVAGAPHHADEPDASAAANTLSPPWRR